MDVLREYDIEFIKLKEGQHRFEYHITDAFFKAFDSSLSTQEMQVTVLFTKSGSMFTLDFEINGKVELDCDRCLTTISLPLKDKNTVLVKVTEHPLESGDDLIYLSTHDYKLNVAQHVYDFILLSIPIKKTCSDIGRICDPSVTEKINSVIDVETIANDIPERDSDDEEDED